MEELMLNPIGRVPITLDRYIQSVKKLRDMTKELIHARKSLRDYRARFHQALFQNKTAAEDPRYPHPRLIGGLVDEALTDLATLR